MERTGGRAADELRPVRITRRYLKHAHGSCLMEFGDTRVLCAANLAEGVASWRKGSGLGWITAEYSLLPASTHTRRRRETGAAGLGGRTHEIQRLIGRALRSVADLAGMGGEVTMNVDCDVIQADGGTRSAALTGAFLAMHDALSTWRDAGKIRSVPVFEHVAAVSVGIVDGVRFLDLDYAEDSAAEVDMNVAMDGQGRFIEVQGTGEKAPFDRGALDALLEMAAGGCARLVGIQKRVLDGDMEAFEG